MTQQQYYYGTGRRKNAVARVRVYANQGPVTVNGKPVEEVFPVDSWQQLALRPLMVTNTRSEVTVVAKTHGGGSSGQACLLYTSPSPRDGLLSRMPSSA